MTIHRHLRGAVLSLLLALIALGPLLSVPARGADADSYTVGTAAELRDLAELVNGGDDFSGRTVTLTGNIDLGEENWTPIGTAIETTITYTNPDTGRSQANISSVSDESKPFNGTFDGGGHTISNLSIDTDRGGQGLFGYLGAEGTVRNFTVQGAITTTVYGGTEGAYNGDYVGGAVGYNRGVIYGVVSDVAISAPGGYNIGGVAGFNDGRTGYGEGEDVAEGYTGAVGQIIASANLGDVHGNTKVGGIAGQNAGLIHQCYNSGEITMSNNMSKNGTGGIAGRNGNNNSAVEQGTISYCYNTGNVGTVGGKWIGGIAGFNNARSSIHNCYTTGAIYSLAGYSNPIAGQQEGANNTYHNYALNTISSTGNSESESGIRVTAEQMRASTFPATLNRYGGGDYFVYDSEGINDGYPILMWQAGAVYVDYSFVLSPAAAAVSVADSGGAAVSPAADGTYTLVYGQTYTYTVTAEGYDTMTGTITAGTTPSPISVNLETGAVGLDYTFEVTPSTAGVEVLDSEGEAVSPAGGVYTLTAGGVYSYSVSAEGYSTRTGTIVAGTTPSPVAVYLISETGDDVPATYVDEEELRELIAQTGKRENVVISAVPEDGESTVTLAFSRESVGEIAQGAAGLVVDTPAAAICLSAASLTDLHGRDGDGDTVYITVTANGDESVTVGVRVDEVSGAPPADGIRVCMPVPALLSSEGRVGDALRSDLVGVTINGTTSELIPKSIVYGDTAYLYLESSATVSVVGNMVTFGDVPSGEWYYAGVSFAASHGLVQGTGENTFSPDANMTRAMLVTLLHRLEKEPEAGVSSGFADIPDGEYFTGAVYWAQENAVVTGVSSTEYDPHGDINREQMVTMIYRYAGLIGLDVSDSAELAGYADSGEVSDWAEEAMAWAIAVGLVEGKGENTLDPSGPATRAEVATILQRTIDLMQVRF